MTQFSHTLTTCLVAGALSGLALAGCQESGSRKAAAIETAKPNAAGSADTAAVEEEMAYAPGEYIDWKATTINGKQPLLGKTAELYRLLGQPDSLVAPNMDEVCVSYFDKKFTYAYFKHSLLEVYGDTAVIGTLDFRNNPKLALHTPALHLSQTTTLQEVAQKFPQAVKNRHTINVQDLGELTAVELATGSTPSDDGWILFFDKDKLVRIDYWMPC
ncbi:hypothetical protein [Hymenobacter fodinae]|uniref:Lipoprotein n=1 Tax=Hymenobacter fodinae TaxID=2510796 RepID=A0A4Z0P6J0_9BACT|nr:hypothetical protein [Hymenobacter fodinae]TGE08024.1 hypothetical protein EU556_09790 [Hymenobacter fodinae]